MEMTPEVITALTVLRNAAENDFERHRINVLERDLTSPPRVEVIDSAHQKLTLIEVMDLSIALAERAIQYNARVRNEAYAEGDITYGGRLDRFSKRLQSLHSQLIVARAEVTDLFIHGCEATNLKAGEEV